MQQDFFLICCWFKCARRRTRVYCGARQCVTFIFYFQTDNLPCAMSIFSFDLELRLKGQMSSRAFAPSVIQVKLSSNMYTWNFHSVGPFHLHKGTFGNCNLKQSGDGAINQNRREPHNWSPRGQTMKDITMHIHSKRIEVKRSAIAPESLTHNTSIYIHD